MAWTQDSIASPARRARGKFRYRRLEHEARGGRLDLPLAVLAAGYGRFEDDDEQLDALAATVCDRLLRDEFARGANLTERAWAVHDPHGRVPWRRIARPQSDQVMRRGAVRLRSRLAPVLTADPEPDAIRAAAWLAHLGLLHEAALGVLEDVRLADRVLRGLLDGGVCDRLAARRRDGMAAVGYESWRRVWALTLVDLAREDDEPGGPGHEAWLRAKVRGELNRGAGDGDGSSSTLPADAEALLRSTSARFSARRADRRPAPAV